MTREMAIKILNQYDVNFYWTNGEPIPVAAVTEAVQMAVGALEAQESRPVKYTTSTIRCPKCNKQITSRGAIHNEINFCWKCGQAVKWDG